MELLHFFGYVSALLIGIVLGLIGGGGSILTVPVLVYMFALNPVVATAYSLFIVGITALVGAVQNLIQGKVAVKTAVVFSIPSFIAVYLTRKYIVPALPDPIFSTELFSLSKNTAIMVFFAIIMVVAALSMIKNKQTETFASPKTKYNYSLIILEGLVVGVLTGIVGAGGGFLIIPALVILAKLPIKTAIATSLLIIAVKSLIGFLGDVQNLDIDWRFLFVLSLLSIIGIFIGIKLNQHMDGKKLKKGFGWFVLLMAIYILTKEAGVL